MSGSLGEGPRAQSAAATRMRRYRQRKAAALKLVRIELPEEVIQELVERGELDWYRVDDPVYMAQALGRIFTERAGEAM